MVKNGGAYNASAKLNTSNMLDISGLSSISPMDIDAGAAHFGGPGGIESRRSLGGPAPSDLGHSLSLMPYLNVETRPFEVQCDIWSVAERKAQEEKVEQLTEQLEAQKSHIDDLERKLETTNKMTIDSDRVKKLKFDNHVYIQ